MAIAASVRLFFNLRHTGRTRFSILLVGAAALLALAIGLEPDDDGAAAATEPPCRLRGRSRRSWTSAASPATPASSAPAGLRLDDAAALVARADARADGRRDAARCRSGNQTGMTDAERAAVVALGRQEGAPAK